jgi:hypothetical protein
MVNTDAFFAVSCTITFRHAHKPNILWLKESVWHTTAALTTATIPTALKATSVSDVEARITALGAALGTLLAFDSNTNKLGTNQLCSTKT